MENRRNNTVTVAIITGLVALLVGLCLGAVAGGAGGYLLGLGRANRTPRLFATATPRARQLVPNPQPFAPNATPTPRNGTPGASSATGVTIIDVTAGSPADDAGLQPGDVILELDGAPIDANHPLATLLSEYKPGDHVTLTVERDGVQDQVDVTLGQRAINPGQAYLGVRYSQ